MQISGHLTFKFTMTSQSLSVNNNNAGPNDYAVFKALLAMLYLTHPTQVHFYCSGACLENPVNYFEFV